MPEPADLSGNDGRPNPKGRGGYAGILWEISSRRYRAQKSMTTKADCAQRIAAYLANEISHDELIKWADAALVEEAFSEKDGRSLLGVLSDLSASRAPGFL